MADTTFTDGSTVVASSWLNDINDHVYNGLSLDGQPIVNVMDPTYGAVGNGVTNDAAAIQAAINALSPSVGGVVIFPAGTYLIGSAIEITRSSVTLRGSRGAIIKLANSAVGTLAYGSMIVAFQKLNLTIEGLAIDGNKANNDINDNYGNGINIYDCQRVTVANNHIYNCPRDGITISDHTRLDPAALGNEDIIVANNVISSCGSTSQTTGGEGILVVQGNGVIISNNLCRDNKYRGIEVETLASTVDYRGCVNITVENNICNDNTVTGIGINGPSRLLVVGNICEGNNEYGIRVNSATVVASSNIIISDNRIDNSTTGKCISIENYEQLTVSGNITSGGVNGLYLTDVEDILASGNVISGSRQHGVLFNAGTNQNIIFNGNLIRASGQQIANTYDNIQGTAIYCVLSGNRIDGTSARYGINASGSSWTVIGNALDNSGTTGIINDTTSGGARTRDNGGYITEALGTATITSGSTSVVITHGCSRTPPIGSITVIGAEDPTNTPGAIWISSITSTQFTINVENNPGASNFDVGWRVQML
jgi:nitrous oxidase accessory protein NosD